MTIFPSRIPSAGAAVVFSMASMTQRHFIQNEATMFITTNVLNRKPVFANQGWAREAVECLYRVQEIHPFILHGFVIMPDHCHFLLRVIEPYTIAQFMSAYKSGLTFDIGVPKLWQRRYYMIIPKSAWNVLSYIHQNPVVAGLVEKPEDYPWSSASGKWEVTPLID